VVVKAGVVVDNVTTVKFPPQINDFEGWISKKRILVILAHPDDPEFFCGALISKWALSGHEIHYCLLTKGQKGARDTRLSEEEIAEIRVKEQNQAARSLGVKTVTFLNYIDGELVPDLQMRREVVRAIRMIRPHIVVTSDPQNYFPGPNRINHPDHRAAGQVVVDAIFPGAGSPMYFRDLETEENLTPVSVDEVWLSATSQSDLTLDMSQYFENKVNAILCHKSQISVSKEDFIQMMKTRFIMNELTGKMFFPERLKRIIF
jgi:LmbE family N-acetylglucosaminyl deacetylase